MKSIFYTILFTTHIIFLSGFLLLVKSQNQTVTSKIEEVTVYLNGAQINRTASINLEKGRHTLIFAGLSYAIRNQSLQVGSSSYGVLVLSVKQQTNFLQTGETKAAIQELKEEKKDLTQRLKEAQNQLMVYQEEEDLLKSNKKLGGENTALRVTHLNEMADFFRNRLLEIKGNQLEMENQIADVKEKIEMLNRQLGELNGKNNQQTEEILVTVEAEANTNALFELSYLVNNANWHPVYDVRVNNVNQPLTFVYGAAISQNTGVDWNNVSINLSTTNPNQRGTKPNVNPWYLDFPQNRPVSQSRSRGAPAAGETPGKTKDIQFDVEAAPKTVPSSEIARATHYEYQLDIPYDIPSDNKEYTADIRTMEMEGRYEFYAAPKYDRNAYLTAHVGEWDQYNLLSGNVNLYFEGRFIGNAFLDVQNVEDSLTFSLGQDKNIVINRNSLENFTSRQFIGGNKKVTRAWEIEVRNTKNVPVKLNLEDQFPVSQNQDIEVEQLQTSGGMLDDKTGKIKWHLQLAPSETKKVTFKYSVKYPKDKYLPLE